MAEAQNKEILYGEGRCFLNEERACNSRCHAFNIDNCACVIWDISENIRKLALSLNSINNNGAR